MCILRHGFLSLAAVGLLLVCVIGVSGCDSKPSDGSQVPDSGTVAPEQKAKVDSFYENRHKAAAKSIARKKR